MEERLYRIALSLLPGIGSMLFKNLIVYRHSAKEVFKSGRGKLLKIPGIGVHTAELLAKPPPLREAEEVMLKAEKTGAQIVFFDDPVFPKRLLEIYDGPALVYIKGSLDFLMNRSVGIVGTRDATEYGKRVTSEITEGLQPYNATVVSGLAYGIDIAAHKAALEHDLPTVAVMASGVDVVYPAAHKAITEKIIEKGALVSEYPFGDKPDPRKFPARNRIIAGLSDALVVVEAATQGGALITAEIADSYNKPVFAVPGNLDSSRSEGCNQLIRQHKASIFTSVRDLAETLQWDTARPANHSANEEIIVFENISEQEQKILSALYESGGTGIQADLLSYKTGIGLNRLASVLLELELKGFVRMLPGNIYVLVKKYLKFSSAI